ncbi:Phenylpyruvate tautomerase PptA, 4-oxalocrotonate tautomerase family [Pseudoxanthomonas sp. GM95]|uniref:tautomerase family protein n=1 Tax=Pseudoxanthomonas sp. GM95 TaxID=1881043 RepID=UPI0008CB960A|nr:tautomerase family protein [Pseudoxanthomonas sp. GM95]SEM21639.1 Phenylpyruvate tautomerase PptA, 4-oxalocrotonate tautomerase family [Pseudoxanthomonas sp. GM95]
MPTYFVTSTAPGFDPDTKAALAQAITRIHHEVTGAQTYFAEVIFQVVDAGSYFIGGQPVAQDNVLVYGHIRKGRSEDQLQALITGIVDQVAALAGWPASSIWVYLNELAPAHMAEFGQLLPAPGQEDAWFRGLPDHLRAYLEGLSQAR